ncbi:hypothetical protein [Pseudoalteromonas phage J2-1]|uniref:Uncharacterized protein n=1 Tax=Pseudoalteromonas phage J2-1 TaxID=2023998 RepID=A0A223LHJ9_9CAUD|nr:hypothetical protein HOR90_gp46 [Pseudoalteromonas phage J2-1]ASU03333.1 hypothetical protein [Pseudoalteromonas phage J2-1]
MKYKVISFTQRECPQRESIFNVLIGEYTIKSLCGGYVKIIGHNEYEKGIEEDGYINFYGVQALERVITRLTKIGIELELIGNVPWVYLRSVNGIPVTEKKNARHGYCVDYMIGKRHLNFRKDLFAKVRELVKEKI